MRGRYRNRVSRPGQKGRPIQDKLQGWDFYRGAKHATTEKNTRPPRAASEGIFWRAGAVDRLVNRSGVAQLSRSATVRLPPRFLPSAFYFFLPMLRRTFLKNTAVAATATAFAAPTLLAAAAKPAPKIAVGLDNYALRAIGWKAPAAHRLRRVAQAAIRSSSPISMRTAKVSTIPLSASCARASRSRRSHAVRRKLEHLPDFKRRLRKIGAPPKSNSCLGMRVAKNSRLARSFAPSSATWKTARSEGGIQARIADTIAVIKACRRRRAQSRFQNRHREPRR
jgi:hypothetical protein